jgi:hypothetical protein
MKTTRIDHDRLFKQLIETCFEDFMLYFFSEIHQQLDFAHTRFLPQEVFTDVTVGEKRAVDLLVETKLRTEDCLLIVHTEHQEQYEPAFAERMFVYFSRLYEKYRRKILPIAIFMHERNVQEPEQFIIELPFKKVLTFEFLVVQ